MASQAVSTNISNHIDIGNAIVYVSKAAKSSFSSAKSATDWRKLGILKDGLVLDRAIEKIEFRSGVPLTLQKQYFVSEAINISGQILEFNAANLARVAGLSVSRTVKASSPAPTTVASGSTKSVINFTSVTGYAVDDLIQVGNSGSEQYGVIKSISGTAVTLYEALDNDTNPTTGHAIAKVDVENVDFGNVSAPPEIAIKIVKTLVGTGDAFEVYVLKAQSDGSLSLNWADGGATVEGVGIPFSFAGLSDALVESGKVMRMGFTQA